MGRQHYGPVVSRINPNPLVGRHEPAHVIACQSCQFAHVAPLPSQADVDALYTDAYYATEKPRYLEEFEEDEAWWRLVYRERLEILEQMVGGRMALDVGSGPGGFLAEAMRRGWAATGVEPALQAASYSRTRYGANVFQMPFQNFLVGVNAPVDAIHASEVLEHVADPLEWVQQFRQLLKPNGVLCVVVPNDFNALQLRLNESVERPYWWVEPKHHLNYFTFYSLKRLLSHGFEVQQQMATFPMELFLVMGYNYVGHPNCGRACHDDRKRLELQLDALGFGPQKQAFYRSLAAAGLGREIVMYARRTE